ncbi:LCP family protein [Peterkaempfera bronchialis]|uniref:LCP family protein n=1 Tax=Peterkaempfera bronchialis TaxID=2126346 RepID=UPI003C2B2608
MAEQQKDQQPPSSGRSGRRGLRVAGLSLAGVVLVAAGFGGFAYWKLNHNLTSVDMDSLLGRARPPASTNGDFNLLLLGSDSRAGANHQKAGGANDGTARSDTAMVVHIERDHRRGSVVSIPRDTLVDRPECTKPDGSAVPAVSGAMFNSAFEVGGAACAVKTVESITGLRMDHFMEMDFAGFAGFIDAIGGVDVTTAVDIRDKQSRLTLAHGTHHLSGDQALAFVRTRHGVGDGSDLGRIELQHQMVTSILRQAQSAGLLANPVKLFKVADTLTRSITADTDLASVNALVGLSQRLKGIGPGDLAMATLPVHYAPSNPNRVVATEPQASRLWEALKDDRPIPADILKLQPANPATTPKSAKPATSAKPTGKPAPSRSAAPHRPVHGPGHDTGRGAGHDTGHDTGRHAPHGAGQAAAPTAAPATRPDPAQDARQDPARDPTQETGLDALLGE